jgi:hypothetical protein
MGWTIMKRISRIGLGVLAIGMMAALTGCDGMTSLFANSDPSLRKTPTEFAADAAKRHYEADAPTATDSGARAQYDLTVREISLTNTTDTDWSNVEVWVNRKYVVYLPQIEGRTDKSLNFNMFFDDSGNRFDTDGGRQPIKSIEVFMDGKMCAVPNHVAD